MSSDTITTEFRTVDDGINLPDNYVNPYYIEELKLRVCVARVKGALFAFDDLYKGNPLSVGLLTGTILMSQFDGSQFDITTGEVLRGPANAALKKYEVREQDGKIQIRC